MGPSPFSLKEVPWDQALDVVLENQGMGRHLSGNVLRIARLSTLEAEQQQQQRLAQARVAAAELETRIRRPSFAKAAELSPILEKALSPRGDIIVDERTNALVVSDIPARLEAVDALLSQLDRKVRQVEIEARVVAASRSFLQDIGSDGARTTGGKGRGGQQEESDPGPAFSRFPVLDDPDSGGGPAAGEERPRLSLDLRTGLPASPLNLAAGLAADSFSTPSSPPPSARGTPSCSPSQDPDPEQRARGGEAGDSDSHPDHREQHRSSAPLHRLRCCGSP